MTGATAGLGRIVICAVPERHACVCVVVRVASMDFTHTDGKAGVMMRDSSTTTSPYALVAVTTVVAAISIVGIFALGVAALTHAPAQGARPNAPARLAGAVPDHRRMRARHAPDPP